MSRIKAFRALIDVFETPSTLSQNLVNANHSTWVSASYSITRRSFSSDASCTVSQRIDTGKSRYWSSPKMSTDAKKRSPSNRYLPASETEEQVVEQAFRY